MERLYMKLKIWKLVFLIQKNKIMKRVVITGMGIVSCIGNDKNTVIDNLKNLKSGISEAP